MLLAPLVAMCMVISAAMPATALPASATETGGASQDQVTSRNIWTNEYSSEGGGNWASTVMSHIEATDDGGYDIVEWADSALHVEHYDSRFSFVSSRAITPSTYTPTGATAVRWGGYLNGSLYRFVVTGQANPTESDGVAVIRVKILQVLAIPRECGIFRYQYIYAFPRRLIAHDGSKRRIMDSYVP